MAHRNLLIDVVEDKTTILNTLAKDWENALEFANRMDKTGPQTPGDVLHLCSAARMVALIGEIQNQEFEKLEALKFGSREDL